MAGRFLEEQHEQSLRLGVERAQVDLLAVAAPLDRRAQPVHLELLSEGVRVLRRHGLERAHVGGKGVDPDHHSLDALGQRLDARRHVRPLARVHHRPVEAIWHLHPPRAGLVPVGHWLALWDGHPEALEAEALVMIEPARIGAVCAADHLALADGGDLHSDRKQWRADHIGLFAVPLGVVEVVQNLVSRAAAHGPDLKAVHVRQARGEVSAGRARDKSPHHLEADEVVLAAHARCLERKPLFAVAAARFQQHICAPWVRLGFGVLVHSPRERLAEHTVDHREAACHADGGRAHEAARQVVARRGEAVVKGLGLHIAHRLRCVA
mmetsp:Transcript_24577/g.62218  ORF Transcript_24577/g.62218 Transcript_24577/m.62218 type:complete len:323 (-) Transcript_24577:127-1095(-)